MEKLPKDVAFKIFLDLSPPDVINFCLTDKANKKRICDNPEFWIKKLEKDYPYTLLLPLKHKIPLSNPKNTYIREFTNFQKKIEEYVKDIDVPLNGKFLENYEKSKINIQDLRKEFARDIHKTVSELFERIEDDEQRFMFYRGSLSKQIIEKHLKKYFGNITDTGFNTPDGFSSLTIFLQQNIGRPTREKLERGREYRKLAASYNM